MSGSLASKVKPSPLSGETGRSKTAGLVESDPELADALIPGSPAEALLAGISEGSPYLWQLASSDPERLRRLLTDDPISSRDRVLAGARAAAEGTTDEAELMRRLRKAKQEMALLTGLADLGQVWTVPEVTGALTDLADTAISSSLKFLLRSEAERGKIRIDPAEPEKGCGLFVLAMGKHGARELNYSSDIDLIVLFDRDTAPLADDVEPVQFFVKIVQRLVRIMQERTADGYVFRTDLRLRPDPGSTAVAISTAAALSYYESVGQNWERAAMIKARTCAGDIAAGDEFLAELTPFIWRKYLDYAAIADVHAMKRQIHVHRGHGVIAVEGHNVKLGRGGIREIEFFVQTQQLVAGGRNPALRSRSTEETLGRLVDLNWIDGKARDELVHAYRFLRTIEHRLQMVRDEQTHSLPSDDQKMADFARFSGFESRDAFADELRRQLEIVQGHYARLFEDAPALDVAAGSLVFTGDEDDPETLATLQAMGFKDPVQVSSLVRGWHHGRVPATRSARARELLTELVPSLLDTFAKTSDPNGALRSFDRVLSQLSGGVQFFAILRNNPGFLGLIADALGTAPRIAQIVGKHPHVLDAVLEPAFFSRLPSREELKARLDHLLRDARSYEDILDRARIFGQEQRVLIGMRVLSGVVGADAAGWAFARLADVLIERLHEAAEEEMAQAHGRVPGGRSSVLAMGKLGGREMTAASDLDVILIYEHPDDADVSDGPRGLPPSQYYARLTQRLIAALSAPTAEGTLYEVDLRLRPSGKAGPLATRLKAFSDYQISEAWTWEHMALTRGRAVSGPHEFRETIETVIVNVLTQPHDPAKTTADVVDMRKRLSSEKGDGSPWDIKFAAGGLIDLEFIAQYLQLVHAHEHPGLLSTSTATVLRNAFEVGLLSDGQWEVLNRATVLQHNLTQILRLCLTGKFDPAAPPRGVANLLARAAAAPDFPALNAELLDVHKNVRAVFEDVVRTQRP